MTNIPLFYTAIHF